MESLILHLIFWVVNHGPVDRGTRVNQALTRMEAALEKGDYLEASRPLRYLVDSLRVPDPPARLDLAHALFMSKDTLNARLQYQRLDSVREIPVRSVALQQLGVLAGSHQAVDQALAYFKQTLKADPTNEDARYNYELLKKKREQPKEEQEQKSDPKNQEPSAFAKRLKAQAEGLVSEHQYAAAYRLMNDGKKKDPTVASFDEFIKRIGKVANITR